MFYRVTSWAKIIAALVGGIGLSGVFSAWPVTFSVQRTWISCDWPVMIVSVLLLAMSYPLATRREWARRILQIAVLLIGVSFVLWRGVQLFPKSFTDLSPEQIKVVRLGTFLGDLSSFFLILTLVIFFVLIAFTFRHFVQILQRLQALARERASPVALEQHPITDSERASFIDFIRTQSPNIDFTFWEMLLETPR